MGKSIRSKYALRIKAGTWSTMCWFVGEDGKPTQASLEKWVESYHNSLKPGGANDHLSDGPKGMPILSKAMIVTNDNRQTVVVEWTAPAFMVI